LTICPCCGSKCQSDLRAGCRACGARSVGEPLARPEHELPSYGRALFVGVLGALLLITFIVGMASALLTRPTLSFDTGSLIMAAETAAWRLKLLALPVIPFALWASARICASIRREPWRFMGSRFAHGGLVTSALVAVLIATFIGVTIPERLRQRQRGIEAAYRAQLYTIARAQLEYRLRYGTLPASLDDLRDRERLPDADGSIAAALAGIASTDYKSWSIQARLPEAKSRKPRGTALRRVSLSTSTDDMPDEGVTFTNYEVRLPGEDKTMGTDDDWMIRDGVIVRPFELTRASSPASASVNGSAP
jgi:type II secretory pathway pseudopilin PulG